MYRPTIVFATLAVVLLSGCALTPEGVRIPLPSPDAGNTEKIIRSMRDATLRAGARMAIDPLLVAEDRPGIIIIGGLGPLRRLEAEERAEFYRGATTQSQKFGLPAPRTTEAEFVAGMAGYASVFFNRGPFSLHRHLYAAVPSPLVDTLNAPSSFTTSLYAATGDLVVAQSHQDGWNQVVAVLCDDSREDYWDCDRQYRWGRYDRSSGYALSNDNEVLTDGVRIDPRTYRVLPAEVAQ